MLNLNEWFNIERTDEDADLNINLNCELKYGECEGLAGAHRTIFYQEGSKFEGAACSSCLCTHVNGED